MQRCTTYGRAEARQVGWDTIPLACFFVGATDLVLDRFMGQK